MNSWKFSVLARCCSAVSRDCSSEVFSAVIPVLSMTMISSIPLGESSVLTALSLNTAFGILRKRSSSTILDDMLSKVFFLASESSSAQSSRTAFFVSISFVSLAISSSLPSIVSSSCFALLQNSRISGIVEPYFFSSLWMRSRRSSIYCRSCPSTSMESI